MPGDVVDLIMQDHAEVERLLEQLRNHPAKRPGLVPVLTNLLFAHSRAEEAEVYPAAADEAGASDDVEHSQEEHVEADELLAQLADADPTSAAFDQILSKVIDAVTHPARRLGHVQGRAEAGPQGRGRERLNAAGVSA